MCPTLGSPECRAWDKDFHTSSLRGLPKRTEREWGSETEKEEEVNTCCALLNIAGSSGSVQLRAPSSHTSDVFHWDPKKQECFCTTFAPCWQEIALSMNALASGAYAVYDTSMLAGLGRGRCKEPGVCTGLPLGSSGHRCYQWHQLHSVYFFPLSQASAFPRERKPKDEPCSFLSPLWGCLRASVPPL